MNKYAKNRKSRIIFFSVLGIFAVLWLISWIPVTEHISFKKPSGDGNSVRLALITDLHSCYYGKNQNGLIKRIEKENPDLVLLGGDIFDDKLKDKNAEIATKRLAEKYPCYYVTGNHEYWSGRVPEIKDYLNSVGVKVLNGNCETVTVNGVTFDLCGIDDPTQLTGTVWREQIESARKACKDSHIKILLTHRPEPVYVYSQYHFDYIFSGHAHAGQIRIPFLKKGLYAPNQGFLAEYISGAYALSDGSTMVVSRGLARESTPAPRFFNHPEVVIIDLK